MPLIKGAIEHQGAAFIDCIGTVGVQQPSGSDEELRLRAGPQRGRELSRRDRGRDEITADYGPGTVETVTQHDGSVLRLRKLHADYDPTNRLAAMTYLQERQDAGEIVTGLLYLNPEPEICTGGSTPCRAMNTLAEPEPARAARPRPIERRVAVRAVAATRSMPAPPQDGFARSRRSGLVAERAAQRPSFPAGPEWRPSRVLWIALIDPVAAEATSDAGADGNRPEALCRLIKASLDPWAPLRS